MRFEDRLVTVSVDGVDYYAEVRSVDIETSSIIVVVKYSDGEETVRLKTELPPESPKESILFNVRTYEYEDNIGVKYLTTFSFEHEEETIKVER